MKREKQRGDDREYYNRLIVCAVVFVGAVGCMAAYLGRTSIYSVPVAMLLLWFCLHTIK